VRTILLAVRAFARNRVRSALTTTISLLVGGIGIMNIMLVSVTERTPEIGLRMAIGARTRDIHAQFLVESLVLGLAGGIAGIAFGVGAAHAITGAFDMPLLVSSRAVAVAVLASAGAGLVFGYFPARHAANLDPIEALRAET
jgi:putative ABC transport system permease protein